MTWLTSVASVASTAYSTQQEYQASKVQQQAIDYQSRQEVANQEAQQKVEAQQTELEIQQLARDGSRAVGSVAASSVSNGAPLWGSSLEALNDQVSEIQRAISTRQWESDVNQAFTETNKQTTKNQAKYEKAGAKYDRTTSLLRGVNSTLRVASNYFDR